MGMSIDFTAVVHGKYRENGLQYSDVRLGCHRVLAERQIANALIEDCVPGEPMNIAHFAVQIPHSGDRPCTPTCDQFHGRVPSEINSEIC
jgi:hypothetical protein